MKKIFYIIFLYILLITSSFAASKSYLGIEDSKLRDGTVTMHDIPIAIKSTINFLMGIAGTIAVIFVIIGAYKILFGSIKDDKTEGKNTIIMALVGFALAALSWFIIKLIIDNFSG